MITKKIIAIAAICTVLCAGGVTAAMAATSTNDVPPEIVEDVNTSVSDQADTEIPVEEEEPVEDAEEPQIEAEEEVSPKRNIPAEGDEIVDDEYFIHIYSDGSRAYVPFDPEIERNNGGYMSADGTFHPIPNKPVDVEALKKFGSGTPFKDEISYIAVEFLDGTRRYYRSGEEMPKEFLGADLLRYGIIFVIEPGIGEYYEEVVDGGIISGWR